MKIYIASSWKNQHGVEMLTVLLRERGHEVVSWIENNYGELATIRNLSFEKWMETDGATRSFVFDTDGAKTCDVMIYYGPAGQDAAAEAGIAWSAGVPIIGLWAKGEGLGLMRKMMICWCENYRDVMSVVAKMNELKEVKSKGFPHKP